MDFLDLGSIRELFFFVLRLMAAAGGFLAGYLLTGPVVRGMFRLAFHRPMPKWSAVWAKVIAGLVVAVAIFIYLQFGTGGGGSGGGTGGGTGAGMGKSKGGGEGEGEGKNSSRGKGSGLGQGQGAQDIAKAPAEAATLVIEMLGPTTAEGDKCYKVHRKGPPVNLEAVEAYWNNTRAQWARVEIVLTKTSASENDPAVDSLRKLVQTSDDHKKRTFVIADESGN